MSCLRISSILTSLFLLIGTALHTQETNLSPIVAERDEMFMLATLAYAYNNLNASPTPGHDIASSLAWGVEDVEHTPEFVLERNRNFEMQGEIFHAEINTLRKAILKKYDFSVGPIFDQDQHYGNYSYRLSNATLYTSLEPCPMCAMTILIARVPRVIYFMEDTGIRDLNTHELMIPLPTQAYKRKVTTTLSSIPLAKSVQQAMQEAIQKDPAPSYVRLLPNGQKVVRVLDYIKANAKDFFGFAYGQLSHYSVQHEQNRQLFENLRRAVGMDATASG